MYHLTNRKEREYFIYFWVCYLTRTSPFCEMLTIKKGGTDFIAKISQLPCLYSNGELWCYFKYSISHRAKLSHSLFRIFEALKDFFKFIAAWKNFFKAIENSPSFIHKKLKANTSPRHEAFELLSRNANVWILTNQSAGFKWQKTHGKIKHHARDQQKK